jgi:hypothetical protein
MTSSVSEPLDDVVPPGFLFQAVAHSSDTVMDNLGHACRHAVAVRNSSGEEERTFNLAHVVHHIGAAYHSQRAAIPDLAAWNPGVRAALIELDDISRLPGSPAGRSIPPPGDDMPPADRPVTVAHLASAVWDNICNAKLHADRATDVPDHAAMLIHLSHVQSHVDGAIEHQRKYISALRWWYPDVAAELDALEAVTSLGSRSDLGTERAHPGLPLADDRCDLCGDPKTPGRPCDNPVCAGSADTDAARARAELAAEFAKGSRWEGALG